MSNRDMSDTTTRKIGQILVGNEKMDAIHIAVIPMIASVTLNPGQVVAVDGLHAGPIELTGHRIAKIASGQDDAVGIVDPFLRYPVRPGSHFYLFLYPGTITSLRHEWTHPAFDGQNHREIDSKRWIEHFAQELDYTYNRLIRAAEDWLTHEEWTYDNTETYKNVPQGRWAEFWTHYEIVTRQSVQDTLKDKGIYFFTCSC